MLPQKHNWEMPGTIIAENYFYLVIIMIKITYPKVMPDQKKIWKKEESKLFFRITKYFKFLWSVLNQKSMQQFIIWRNAKVTHGGGQKHIID